jgi:hypothetical protein
MASDGKTIAVLRSDGYAVYGPQVRDGSIVIDQLQDAAALPHGWASDQQGGTYRLRKRDDAAVFGVVHGADSWKKLLHPAHLRLWSARREGGGFTVQEEHDPAEPFALIGVRGCDMRAIAIQDRVFLEGEHIDAVYQARRRNAFIVGVDCGEPGGTCFCASMGTGPAVGAGYDLALTELGAADADAQHRFVVRVGSERGQAVVDRLHLPEAGADDRANAVAPMIIVGEAAPRPTQNRDAQFLEILNGLLAVAFYIGDRRSLADPKSAVHA